MTKSKHSEAQIIAALRQVEAGRTAEDVARECGVPKHTIYAWKAKFGGMDATEAQKLRALEDENSRFYWFPACTEVCCPRGSCAMLWQSSHCCRLRAIPLSQSTASCAAPGQTRC